MRKVTNWAHRGASGHATENTLSAFKMAVQMGADGIECDLRETCDGHFVIFHDATLKRMANQPDAIAHCSLDQLQQVNLGHRGRRKGEPLPALSQLFKNVNPPCLLNLEIKKGTPEKLLDQVYQHHAQERVLLSSFDGLLLSRIRSLDSHIAIGYLLDQRVTTDILKEARKMKARSLHLDVRQVTEKGIRRLQTEGFQVYAYTVNDFAQMTQLIGMGIDGLFTNYPDRLTRLLSGSQSLMKERGSC